MFRMMTAVAITGTAAALTVAGPAIAELDEIQLEVIVGNHNDPFTQEFQVPYFTEALAERSGGRVTARAVPYTELGLRGFELMNLLKLGTNDISWGVLGYVAGDSPVVEGLELPGISSEAEAIFDAQDSYREIMDRELREKFNSKMILWSQQPALQAYCKLTEEEIENFNLDTMRGKNARVHSTSFADFVESFGGVPVNMPFADVIPALERGVLDCALTSPTAAYGSKFGQVTNAVVEIRSGYSSHFFAMNLDTWNGLNEETQAFLTEVFGELEADMREAQPEIQAAAAACLGAGPCTLGEPSNMAYLKLSEEDEARLRQGVEETVLPRWAERAGTQAAAEWNEAVSDDLGLTIRTE